MVIRPLWEAGDQQVPQRRAVTPTGRRHQPGYFGTAQRIQSKPRDEAAP